MDVGNGRRLRELLKRGERVYGTRIVSPSPLWPGIVSEIGLDFVFLDLEHIPLDRERLAWMCQGYRTLGVAPVVRILQPDPFLASAALEGGAVGIVAPYVETVDQVRALRGAVKLNPLKGEKLQAVLAEDRLPPESLREYLEIRNCENLLILNIESELAIRSLDDMLAVPGVDGLLVGPHDLSLSLGVPEQYDDPRFSEAIIRIIQKGRQQQVGVGVHFFPDVSRQVAWAKAGANIILHGTDFDFFSKTLKSDLQRIRDGIGTS
jgi:4-hydroxy-2-oxoheptanedioate aldolase